MLRNRLAGLGLAWPRRGQHLKPEEGAEGEAEGLQGEGHPASPHGGEPGRMAEPHAHRGWHTPGGYLKRPGSGPR